MRKPLRTFIAALLLLAPSVAQEQNNDVELVLIQPNVYLHRSYLQTDDFGRVDCNGLVYLVDGKALVIDTPCNVADSEQLIAKIENELKAAIVGVVVGHTHSDSMGGLAAFQKANIASYGSKQTQDLARKQGLPVPVVGFDNALELDLDGREVRCAYFGPGHTQDNSVTYLIDEKVLFGGCLLKADGASKGNLGDADVSQWTETVGKVKAAFPDVELVVPGHGAIGDSKLLDYTMNLFRSDAKSR